MANKVFTDESLNTLVDSIKALINRTISGKADTSHKHTISDITDLDTTLSQGTQVQIITWGADD